ncbi:MAG: hypothetical protein FWG90_01470 [Oscillospiraceae bacterium]|nr:hypothetical protein [Oscillospiraceae bacterium]
MKTINQKQRCFNVIEQFPEEQLEMLAVSLESMYKMIDDVLDMAFCINLSERYAQSADKDEPGIPLEEVVKNLGFSMEDIENAED